MVHEHMHAWWDKLVSPFPVANYVVSVVGTGFVVENDCVNWKMVVMEDDSMSQCTVVHL